MELKHYGIKGMRHGVRNGPPYPLDERDYSAAEKRAKKEGKNHTGDSSSEKESPRRLGKSARLNYHDQRITDYKYKVARAKRYDEMLDKAESPNYSPLRINNRLGAKYSQWRLERHEKKVKTLLEKYDKAGFKVVANQHTRYADMSEPTTYSVVGPGGNSIGVDYEVTQRTLQRYGDLAINPDGKMYVVRKRRK